MKPFLYFATSVFFSTIAPAASFGDTLEVLARPGPWPVADHLIVYRDQVWFSSAVKGVNHNSADIWSYSPATGTTRFERHLFSQDAGRPIVHKELLYWPHEDMRVGLGKGIVSITNGRDWTNQHINTDEYMMHTHSVVEWKGQLVAAMAGWHSSIAVSNDAGVSWVTLVSDEPRVGNFHRYNDVVTLDDQLFAKHWESDGLKLAKYHEGRMVNIDGWPASYDMSRFVEFKGSLYVIVDAASGKSELWRANATGHEQVFINKTDLELRALASDGDKLWLVTKTGEGGQLWSSADGTRFTASGNFTGGTAYDAITTGVGQVYVSGKGLDGKAILWGPKATVKPETPRVYSSMPVVKPPEFEDVDFAALKSQLRTMLTDETQFGPHGANLRELIFEILEKSPPPGFFRPLLDADISHVELEVFGGQFSVPANEIALWLLMVAMEQNKETTIPPRYLDAPWKRKSNGPQKWFDPILVAMRAIHLTKQNDRTTIDALVARLDKKDPQWLRSQVTGTLSALTDQDFAHNAKDWTDWWSVARSSWPEHVSSPNR